MTKVKHLISVTCIILKNQGVYYYIQFLKIPFYIPDCVHFTIVIIWINHCINYRRSWAIKTGFIRKYATELMGIIEIAKYKRHWIKKKNIKRLIKLLQDHNQVQYPLVWKTDSQTDRRISQQKWRKQWALDECLRKL